MNDFEREEIYTEIAEHLDNIDELVDNYEIDIDEDENFNEIFELLGHVRRIINQGE